MRLNIFKRLRELEAKIGELEKNAHSHNPPDRIGFKEQESRWPVGYRHEVQAPGDEDRESRIWVGDRA